MAQAEPQSIDRAMASEMLPQDREYDSEADAELDRALVEAIEKADTAGNEHLSTVLRYQLGSFYYEAAFGI